MLALDARADAMNVTLCRQITVSSFDSIRITCGRRHGFAATETTTLLQAVRVWNAESDRSEFIEFIFNLTSNMKHTLNGIAIPPFVRLQLLRFKFH